MAICQFFLKGTCRFGDTCRNEHPKNGVNGQGQFGNSSWGVAATTPKKLEASSLPFTQESIARDLTINVEKPSWPLSSYGPAKNEPLLITGLDESFEELRVRAVQALKGGNANEYVTYENQKTAAADQVYNNVKANPQEAFKKAHQNSLTGGVFAQSNVVASASTSTFGQPAFGTPSTSALSQPSTQISAFGQPSAFGTQAQSSAFGTPTQTSTFGQPSFGTSAQSSLIKPATSGAFSAYANKGTSAFGTGMSSGSGGGFSSFANQPSSFSAAANNGIAPLANSPFGPPLAQNTNTGIAPLANSPFGAPLATNNTGIAPLANSPFGPQPTSSAAAPNPSPFGQRGSTFGQTSAVGLAPLANSPFGPPQSAFNTATPASAFATPQQTSAFATSQQTSAFSSNNNAAASSNTFLSAPPMAQAATASMSSPSGPNFAPKQGVYKPGTTPYDSMLPGDYMSKLSEETREAFKGMKFTWGKVPDWIPPLELR